MLGKSKNSLSSRLFSIPRSRRKSGSSANKSHVPKSPRSCRNIVDSSPKSPTRKSPQSCRNFIGSPKSPKSPRSPNSSRSLGASSVSSLSSGKPPKSPRSSRSLLLSARLLVGKKGKDKDEDHSENDDFADETITSHNESFQEIIPVIVEEEEEEEPEDNNDNRKMAAPETPRAAKSSSKSKKKKDKIKEIMLEDGTKKRKKTKRRASMGNASKYQPDSVEFGAGEHSSSFADGDSITKNDGKMMSTRTALTERSSSHHSMSSERLETPRKIKKKAPKNIQEIDGQLWRCDEKGNPISKVRRKSSKSGDIDRLNSTDHGSPCSISETPTKKKNKKAAKQGSSRGFKSVRHISHTGNTGYNSSGSEEMMNDTVGTTGTNSLDNRPKPRRLKSHGDMGSLMEDDSSSFRRKKPERTPSGDLDMLMSQSVHDHTRKRPSVDKPKLTRKGSTMGKLLKLAGKSTKILPGKKMMKDKELSLRSNPEMRSSALPKDVKEIDGILWKVDEHGNKLNKVRQVSSMSIGCSSDEEDESDDDEPMYDIGWSGNLENVGGRQSSSGGASVSGGSVSGSVSNRGEPERKGRRQERRGSMGGQGRSASRDRSVSVSSRRRDRSKSISRRRDISEKSLSTYDAPQKPSRHRSRSMDRAIDTQMDNPVKRSKSKERIDNHNLVQNLQHRLRASEKEVAKLCRDAMEQQDQISAAMTDLRKAQAKLKTANSYKFALTAEVDKLKHELEVKSMLENKYEQPKVENNNNNGNERLVVQICELKQDKESLLMKLDDEKTRGRSRLEAKEEEIRFLQQELERMRAQQGDQYLSYMQKISGTSSSDDESLSASRSMDRNRSMQFVGKILGNHMKDQAQTDLALKKQEIRDLQDRVNNLSISNEKLKKELKEATLTIKDDDDEEVRKAKEAAAQASMAASQHRPRRRLSMGGMSLY